MKRMKENGLAKEKQETNYQEEEEEEGKSLSPRKTLIDLLVFLNRI